VYGSELSLSELYRSLGNALYHDGYLAEAEQIFEKSLEFEDSAQAHHNIGVISFYNGQIPEAEQEFRAALDINPDYAQGHNSLAILLFQEGELEEAATHFRAFTELEPDNVQGHFDLGVSLANNFRNGHGSIEDLQEAQSQFAQAASLDPNHDYAANNADVVADILAAHHDLQIN